MWNDVDSGPIEIAPPFVTYRDSVTIWVDDLTCDVRYVGGAAHTTNDSIVWLPERAVLFCGDLLFSQATPFLLMGSVAGSIEVLETVLRPLGARMIVPGHGPIAGPELIGEVLAYLHLVMDAAAAGLAAGLIPLETARQTDLGPFAGLADPERIVGNLYRAFAELSGTPRGGPVDLAAAMVDMVAYNGGRPLTCLA